MNAEGLRNAFLEIAQKVRLAFPKSQHTDMVGKNIPLLDMLGVLEKILRERSFDDQILGEIARFVDAMKNSIRLNKVKLGNEMPDGLLAADILGSFVPKFGPEVTSRERYLPYWLYSESPYHKMSVGVSTEDSGKINFTYEENTPVVMIPLFNGVNGRPSALEYILWELRMDARDKQCKKIGSAKFMKRLN